MLIVDGHQEPQDVLRQCRIKARHGLIRQQDGRVLGHGSGDGHPLLFSPGQRPGLPAVLPLQMDFLDDVVANPAIAVRRNPERASQGGGVRKPPMINVLPDRLSSNQIKLLVNHPNPPVENPLPFPVADRQGLPQHLKIPPGWRDVAFDHPKKGRFSRAAVSDESDAFSRVEVQAVNGDERLSVREKLHPFHLDDGVGLDHFRKPYLRAMSATGLNVSLLTLT